ncbi:peptidase S8 [Euhalothece natronophila Z-M001]|uniref:Peptidase S8 n=1 Tax=Euhalothece natronophila Z-M001 TaxID=522448 RepID=A0A5B8NN08_9CHRO|nr:S8 family peptidase [Euhalothece natronophila]QDZ40672.1 peptidase S8 [Euhalothece natronophila Z-M001]
MKRLLIFGLFLLGLTLAVWNFLSSVPQGTYNSYVLDFKEEIPYSVVEQKLKTLEKEYGVTTRLNSEFSKRDRVYVVQTDAELPSLQPLKDLVKEATEAIDRNFIYQTFDIPNDPYYSQQWNFRSINLEKAWDESQGEGITVAVIDTGVSKVPDLKQTEFVEGYDFINDRKQADDDVGHGTHVAGTIAQSTNNNYGVAGIAYKAKIMPIKVLDGNGSGTIADIAEGIRFAADNGADVINLSLGGFGDSHLVSEAINYAYDKDVVIVAAAGNSNQNSAAYPARYPRVIGVSALDAAGNKSNYSNYGAGIDISAPGGSEAGKIIQNTINPEKGDSVFAGYQGTSMASPHVAGVAALVKAVGITEPDAVSNVLQQSVRKVQEDPMNHYGVGQLDAGEAVKLAMKGQISVRDFFRWMRDNGYLNPRFWIDGGTVMLPFKLATVIGGYILAWLLRNYFPFGWSWSLASGIIAGSSGLFFLRGIYIFDLPQAPFRIMGSSIPELGNMIPGTTTLNPFFASVLIPVGLVLLFLQHPKWGWFAVGTSLGMASFLAISAVMSPAVWGLGSGWLSRSYLLINAVLCWGLARLASQKETASVS